MRWYSRFEQIRGVLRLQIPLPTPHRAAREFAPAAAVMSQTADGDYVRVNTDRIRPRAAPSPAAVQLLNASTDTQRDQRKYQTDGTEQVHATRYERHGVIVGIETESVAEDRRVVADQGREEHRDETPQ